ncbi:TetR/AcrR family transcriptional regulator [Pseudomonas ogarae]|uniref:TetR/AcrR family transcriptional regulator n=1 Tax=Pseudomonas ogarae (strain DSM 112162 / CECT 30235 / F113) TaxID=1114970 RepID=UPI00399FB4B1
MRQTQCLVAGGHRLALSEIRQKALELFAKCGFSRVSIRDLATYLGIKAGSIYNHIESVAGNLGLWPCSHLSRDNWSLRWKFGQQSQVCITTANWCLIWLALEIGRIEIVSPYGISWRPQPVCLKDDSKLVSDLPDFRWE